MNEGKQKTEGISQRRTWPLEKSAGQRLEANGVTGNICFHRGKKRRGKRGRRDNPTMRIGNPSINAPTTLYVEIALKANDYW